MARGKLVLEKIENKINRQAAFSKRKNGLIRKAKVLSVLCDAEVALIIFSSRGKLSEFGTANVPETLEKYSKQRCSAPQVNATEEETQVLYRKQQILKLKAKCESLERSQSHLLGEELEPLSLKQLYKIEKQLDTALSKTRKKKMQLQMEYIEKLREKELELKEEGKRLKSQLELGQCSEAGQGSKTDHHASTSMGCYQFLPEEGQGVNEVRVDIAEPAAAAAAADAADADADADAFSFST